MARFRLPFARLLVRCAALALALAVLAGLWLGAAVLELRQSVARAGGQTAQLAHAVADTMGRTTERFLALTPSFTAADLAPGARMRSSAELLRVQAAFDAASAVFLADASGNVVAASSPLPAGRLSIGETEWFRAALRGGRDTASARLVETPWLRPGPGVVLTRVISKADGTALGVIGALLPAGPGEGGRNPGWAAPGWAQPGSVVALVTASGEPVISTIAGGTAEQAAPSSMARAYLALAARVAPAPEITAAAPVAGSDLGITARLPRDAVVLAGWPASRQHLAALGGAEVLLLVVLLVLAFTRRRTASPGAEPLSGFDWAFELDRQGRIAAIAGPAPQPVRAARGQKVSALGDAGLAETLARPETDAPGEVTLRLAERLYRLSLQPRAGGWRVAARDITEPAAAEARAEAAEQALAVAHRQLAALEQERDRVLSAVGHDVRTPMTSILGICSLLLEGELEDEQRGWITRMRASCETLLVMLNGLLEIASLDSGAARLHLGKVDVADLVREITETLTPQASDKGLSLTLRQDEGLAGLWHSDPTRLRQVLFNLVDNAIKYTARGKVDVRSAVLSDADGQTSIRITVTDSGPGIAPEERARIFDRFKRGERERDHRGLGLGLALCRDIAVLMGGTLTVESTRDVGSEFTFVVPAERVPDRFEQMPYAGHSCVVIGFGGELQRQLPERLAALGFAVEAAPDGFIGFALAERSATQRGALDLVVLDGALTGMDPGGLARRLQAASFAHNTRILAVMPETGDAAGLAEIVDAHMPAASGATAIARAGGRLVADRSPLASLEAGMAEAAGKRVLIVEDNKINQALLSAALARQGFTTFVADNGEDAIRILAQGAFDAVLMDIQMPGIDGFEATRRIRAADTPARAVPVIALTALDGESIRARCDAAGITAIATKPINTERLGHMLHTWIAQGAALSADGKDAGAFAERDNAQWLGHIQRDWIATSERVLAARGSSTDDAAEDDEDGDPLEVSDVFLECLVADVGLVRARVLVQSFGQDAMARCRQLRELLPGWEVASIATICHNLDGVATTLGAVGLSQCLVALADAARRGAREEAAQLVERLDTILVPTLSVLMARLNGMESQPHGDSPKAA